MENNSKNKFKIDLKKKDWILIGIVISVAAFAFVLHMIIGETGVGSATITVEGKIQGVYSLADDQIIEINGGTNILQIKNGYADMTEADCPDKLCVHQKSVSKRGESIICLPNKVVVSIESEENSEFDAVVQ